MSNGAAIASLVLVVALGLPARAEDAQFPALRGELELALRSEAIASDTLTRSALFAEIELALEAQLARSWFLDTSLIVEPLDSDADEIRHAAFLETLVLRFENAHRWARFGKLTPRFGRAWQASAGLRVGDYAEDYEFAERWGLEVGGRLRSERWGSHALALSSSFADTSALSGSLINDRGRRRRSAGGPANTGRPDSFTLSLDGAAPGRLAALRYHAAFLSHARGRGDPRREFGWVAGLELPLRVSDLTEIAAFAEHAQLLNAGGAAGVARYTTASVELRRGPWHVALGGALRERGGVERARDRRIEASVGYRFASGLSVQLGGGGFREAGAPGFAVGLRIARSFRLGW